MRSLRSCTHRLLTPFLRGVWFLVICSVAAIVTSFGASAHAIGESYVFLTMQGDEVDARIEITTRDLNAALNLKLPEDGSTTLADVAPHTDRIQSYAASRFSLSVPRSDPDNASVSTVQQDFTGVGLQHTTSTGTFVQIGFRFAGFQKPPEYLDVSYRAIFDVVPEHRAMLVVENDWRSATFDNEAMVSLIFSNDTTSATLDLSESSAFRGFRAMVEMGMHHIWIGIDHVLFLMALLLTSVLRRKDSTWTSDTRLKPVLIEVAKIVTVFTVAHTVTLSLSALDVLSMPSRLVESLIAISIAVVAIDIVVPLFRNLRYVVVLVFGLFHGFGFASVLAEMPIPSNYMLLSLLGFNLGVEVGQLAIVLVVVPIMFLLRTMWFYPRLVLPGGASVLVMISVYWFIERAFNVDLPAGAMVNWVIERI